jgi:hypothetical protein
MPPAPGANDVGRPGIEPPAADDDEDEGDDKDSLGINLGLLGLLICLIFKKTFQSLKKPLLR